jgi:hypothetical protein
MPLICTDDGQGHRPAAEMQSTPLVLDSALQNCGSTADHFWLCVNTWLCVIGVRALAVGCVPLIGHFWGIWENYGRAGF